VIPDADQITDAQVEAALDAYHSDHCDDRGRMSLRLSMRAALEAARDA
jgi:hypothetical protein